MEVMQEELRYLQPFEADPFKWAEGVEDDVSWFELVLYWLGELSWWRKYWSRLRN